MATLSLELRERIPGSYDKSDGARGPQPDGSKNMMNGRKMIDTHLAADTLL
jgi:hypothetical protein